MLYVSLLTILGRVSYSIYLVHWPLIVSVRLLSDRELVPQESAFLLTASLALGYGMHHAVETRFRLAKSSDSCGSTHPVRTLAFFFAVGLVLCATAYGVSELARAKRARTESSQITNAGNASTSHLQHIHGINVTELRLWHTAFLGEKQP